MIFIFLQFCFILPLVTADFWSVKAELKPFEWSKTFEMVGRNEILLKMFETKQITILKVFDHLKGDSRNARKAINPLPKGISPDLSG